MDDAENAAKIADPDENDHGEGLRSEPDSVSREFPTGDYTTATDPSQDEKHTSQVHKSPTKPSQTSTEASTKIQNDANTTEIAAGKAQQGATNDTTINKQDAPPTEVEQFKQQNPTISTSTENTSGERDTIDKPPAKPLTETVGQSKPKAVNNSTVVPSQQQPPSQPSQSPVKAAATTAPIPKNPDTSSQPAAEPKPLPLSGNSVPSPTTRANPLESKQQATVAVGLQKPTPTVAVNASSDTNEVKAGEVDEIDPFDAVQIAIRKERTPLTDLYEPYIAPCDTSLADARRRLEIALQQTRKLQNAFTERVYEKYRICLKQAPPIEATLHDIRTNPATALKRLQEEHEQIRIEKEMEKKEASILNAELKRQPNAPADQADQLMYMTAGLNLVMLPEDTSIDSEKWKPYTDGKGPTNEFGQRNKSISAAAATAGELVIERTRKAAALRVERQRRRQLQLLSGDAPQSSIPAVLAPSNISTILQGKSTTTPVVPPTTEVLKKKPDTAKAVASKQPPATAGGTRTGRGRGPSSVFTASTLLSMHYSADQLDVMNHLANRAAAPATSHHHHQVKIAASTSALMAKGVGAATPKIMSTQFRLRHPHPESLGGQRRANTWTNSTASVSSTNTPRQQQPFSEAFLKQTLPPLPTVRDRLERKPLDVLPTPEAATTRAKDSVKKVLDPFATPSFSRDGPKLGDVTKIRVLHNLWKLGNEIPLLADDEAGVNTPSKPIGLSEEPAEDAALDPVVAFMVLHSVGLIGRSHRNKDFRSLHDRFPVLDDDIGSTKLESLRTKIVGSTEQSFTDALFSAKRKHDSEPGGSSPKKIKLSDKSSPTDSVHVLPDPSSERPNDAAGVPVMSIRGGGDEAKETDSKTQTSDDSRKAVSGTEDAAIPSRSAVQVDSKTSPARSAARQSVPTAQTQPREANPVQFANISGSSINPTLPGYLTPPERFHHSSAMNSLHLANQLRQGFQHPAGDIASGSLPYMGQHHPHEGFDLSSFVGTGALQGAHSSITALNYARQNQAVAEARAQIFAREQQAAALLRGAAFSQHGHVYGPVGAPHPAAFAALLGSSNHSGLLNNGQYPMALGGHVGGVPQAMYQPSMVHLESPQTQNTSSQSPSDSQATKGANDLPSIDSPNRTKKKTADNQRSRSTSVDTGERQYKAPTKTSPHPPPNDPETKEKPKDPVEKSSIQPVPKAKDSSKKDDDQEKRAQPGEGATAKQSSVNPGNVKAASRSEDKVFPGRENKFSEESEIREPEKKKASSEDTGAKIATVATAEPKPATQKAADGMRFLAPPIPPLLNRSDAERIRAGRFHEVVEQNDNISFAKSATKYLVDCGGATPIPRSLVLNPLRERLNTPGFKASNANGLPTIPRDVVAYTVLVWLWANHEIAFRDAFEKSGRIDVDPDCKWLIHAAVDTAIRELTSEIAQERATNKGPFAMIPVGSTDELEKSEASHKLELHTAKIVSKSLMTELRVLEEANVAIPNFQNIVEYLDEARMCALRGRSKERALLASLLSQKTNIAESFSHAYTSSMVRAGEALGHESLLEAVQDETVNVSSMLPYDICSDDLGEWEDPCRPETGFGKDASASVLRRRAHARAMIHKSLKKLEDRHGIKGGVPNQGPLSDQLSDEAKAASKNQTAPTPRGGYKRKWSTFSEPPPPPGTGSAPASSWASYDPRHYSTPLDWDPNELENLPYGQHADLERPRSLSLSLSARSDHRSGKKLKRSMSLSSHTHSESRETDGLPRSTCEIPWVEVAGIFQRLELPKKSPPKASHHDHHASVPVPAGSVIVAPFCRRLEKELSDIDDDESETEENLSDEYVIAQHEAVLENMKQKLSAYMEAKQKQQEKKRGRPSRDK